MAELVHNPGIGWEQTSDDLLRIVQGPGRALGKFTADDDDDGTTLISMASLPTFGDDSSSSPETDHRDDRRGEDGSSDGKKWGWLAYVATHPDHRRRGYASSLVRMLLTDDDDTVDYPVGLYGSSAGARLYLSFGFETRGYAQLVQAEGFGSAVAEGGQWWGGRSLGNASRRRKIRVEGHNGDLVLVPASEALPELQRLDAVMYGPGRECDVRRWANDAPTAAVSSTGSGCSSWALLSEDNYGAHQRTCLGYVLSRPMHPLGTFLGPVVASTRFEAEALVHAAVAGAQRGSPVRMLLLPSVVDVGVVDDDGNDAGEGSRIAEELRAVASSLGFRCLGETPSRLMIRDGRGEGANGGVGIPWMERCRLWSSSEEKRRNASGSSAAVVRLARPFAATGYEFG